MDIGFSIDMNSNGVVLIASEEESIAMILVHSVVEG
jgi:hypothetical protein